jgi:hypothetical protein
MTSSQKTLLLALGFVVLCAGVVLAVVGEIGAQPPARSWRAPLRGVGVALAGAATGLMIAVVLSAP